MSWTSAPRRPARRRARARRVRSVAVHEAAEVEHDHVALLDDAGARLVVRVGAVGPEPTIVKSTWRVPVLRSSSARSARRSRLRSGRRSGAAAISSTTASAAAPAPASRSISSASLTARTVGRHRSSRRSASPGAPAGGSGRASPRRSRRSRTCRPGRASLPPLCRRRRRRPSRAGRARPRPAPTRGQGDRGRGRSSGRPRRAWSEHRDPLGDRDRRIPGEVAEVGAGRPRTPLSPAAAACAATRLIRCEKSSAVKGRVRPWRWYAIGDFHG